MKLVDIISLLLLVAFFGYNVCSMKHSKRVFNSTDAKIADHPYQVTITITFLEVLQSSYKVLNKDCAGVIVGIRWIVTVAHCYQICRNDACYIYVRSGSDFRRSGGRIYHGNKLIIHKYFSETIDYRYDAALILTTCNLFRTIPVSIHLARDMPEPGVYATALGWGVSENKTNNTDHLKSIEVKIVDNLNCNTRYLHRGFSIKQDMICVGEPPLSKGISQNDTGGALVFNGTLIGLALQTSPNVFVLPQVYLRIDTYRDWIQYFNISNLNQDNMAEQYGLCT